MTSGRVLFQDEDITEEEAAALDPDAAAGAEASPVLESLRPVIEASKHVRTDVGRISEVASWMAYEKLPFPQFGTPQSVQ